MERFKQFDYSEIKVSGPHLRFLGALSEQLYRLLDQRDPNLLEFEDFKNQMIPLLAAKAYTSAQFKEQVRTALISHSQIVSQYQLELIVEQVVKAIDEYGISPTNTFSHLGLVSDLISSALELCASDPRNITHPEEAIRQKVESFTATADVDKVTVFREGKAFQLPVKCLVFNSSNSDPNERSGIFAPELVRQIAEQFKLAWGIKHAEGYINIRKQKDALPPGSSLEEVIAAMPSNVLFDPPLEMKRARGWIDELDIQHREIGRMIGSGQVLKDTDVQAELRIGDPNSDWVEMWSPNNTHRYLQEMLRHDGFECRLILLGDQIAVWVFSYTVVPEAEIGRSIYIDGKRVEIATKVDTIGYSWSLRLDPISTGGLKKLTDQVKKVRETLEDIAKQTGGVILARMPVTDNPLVKRYVKRLGGFSQATVRGEDPQPDTRKPSGIWGLLSNSRAIVSPDDPSRAYFISTSGKGIPKVGPKAESARVISTSRVEDDRQQRTAEQYPSSPILVPLTEI